MSNPQLIRIKIRPCARCKQGTELNRWVLLWGEKTRKAVRRNHIGPHLISFYIDKQHSGQTLKVKREVDNPMSSAIQSLANRLNKGSSVVFFVGAGISTSAGIPDFRSPGTGLYNNLSKLNLPYAEAVFDIDYFKKDPVPFYTLARELYPGQFKPTKFHLFMALLQERGQLHRVYTQNIDTLERIAGVERDLIVEAHGCFDDHRCVNCSKELDGDKFRQIIFRGEKVECPHCGGYVKPCIVFFGEGLPQRFFECWDEDCDEFGNEYVNETVAIVAGTSLKVHPFASLPEELPESIQRFLVNQELVGTFEDAPRDDDEVYLGKIDEFVDLLCRELGWDEELEGLVRRVEDSTEAEELEGEDTKDTKDSKHIKDSKYSEETKDEAKSKDSTDLEDEAEETVNKGINSLSI